MLGSGVHKAYALKRLGALHTCHISTILALSLRQNYVGDDDRVFVRFNVNKMKKEKHLQSTAYPPIYYYNSLFHRYEKKTIIGKCRMHRLISANNEMSKRMRL